MRISTIAALALLPIFAGSAFAEGTQTRDLTVEQSAAAQAGTPRPGSLQVTVSTDRPDATYALGESVRLFLSANEEAYVTVLDVGPSGQVTQLFPNQFQPDAHVVANRPVEIGGGSTGARIAVAGPVGSELIKVIASNKPLAVISEAQLQGRSAYRSVDGGVKTVTRDLQVVSEQAQKNDTKIAISNFTVHTIASRAPATVGAQTIVVIPGQAPSPQPSPATTLVPVVLPQTPAAALVSVPAQQPFPLLLAADKAAYKVGEKVVLAVTTLQACNLTVLDVTPAGQVRTLFPNQTTPSNAVKAMETVLVAGGPSAVALPVSGPAGTEQIVAICSTEATAVVTQQGDAPADRSALTKNLEVVAARPAGMTSMASLAFVVQQ